MKNRKGFFFVVVTFLVLSYILASLTLWEKNIETSEKRFSEKFRVSNLETVIGQINEEKVNEVTQVMAYNALFNLGEHSIDHPLKAGSGSLDEFYYVNKSMYELLTQGKAGPDNFGDNVELQLPDTAATFPEWVDEINTSLNKMGYSISMFSIEGFEINQDSMDKVNYSFVFTMETEDSSGLVRLEKQYNVAGEITLQGFIDPATAREGQKDGLVGNERIEKQFFFEPSYATTTSLHPEKKVSGTQGQGWMYGILVSTADGGNVDLENRSNHIVVGSYDEIVNMAGYDQFGGYIVTNTPSAPDCADESGTFNQLKRDPTTCDVLDLDTSDTSFTEKPFVVSSGFDINDMGDPGCPISAGTSNKCALIVAGHTHLEVVDDPEEKLSGADIYNIENLRDFTACSYYTHNPNAPSYLQRLFDDAYTRDSPDYGVETFIVGTFIGGVGTNQGRAIVSHYSDENSRVDRDLFNTPSRTGDRIRGMPGCKDEPMCSSDSILGHFRLSTDAESDYLGSQDISCSNGRASCG